MAADATKIIVIGIALLIIYLVISDTLPANQVNAGGEILEEQINHNGGFPDLSGYYKTIEQAQAVLGEANHNREVVAKQVQPPQEQRPQVVQEERAALAQAHFEERSEQKRLREHKQPDLEPVPQKLSGLRDVVAGMAMDIPPENLATFVGSFRQWNKEAEIVLFINKPLSKLHKRICISHDVTVVEFSPLTLQPRNLQNYHPSTYRWPLMKSFFEEKVQDSRNGQPYRSAIVADIRDTAFQSDPFAQFDPNTPGFYAFHDYPKSQVTLGKCGWNGGWVEDCFGKEMRKQLWDSQIYCSGISMGTFHEVWTYLQIMDEIIMSKDFHKCERNGVDQGIHNVLVNLDRIPELKKISQADGWVGNLQAKTCSMQGKIFYNGNGQPISVAHQYDRRKPILPFYEKQYSFWKPGFNGDLPSGAGAEPAVLPEGAEQGAGACDSYKLGKGFDWFMGTCDLRMESGSGPEECCHKCNKDEECQAFTHVRKLCYLKSCKTVLESAPRLTRGTSGYKVS